jgi:hypothetical protein
MKGPAIAGLLYLSMIIDTNEPAAMPSIKKPAFAQKETIILLF